jgi:hypothetical protein
VGIGLVWFMVLNATFNNMSVISLREILLMEETRVPRENHRHFASHSETYHILLYRLSEIRPHNVSGERY